MLSSFTPPFKNNQSISICYQVTILGNEIKDQCKLTYIPLENMILLSASADMITYFFNQLNFYNKTSLPESVITN